MGEKRLTLINYQVKNEDADGSVGNHGCHSLAAGASGSAAPTLYKVNRGQGATGTRVTTDEEREEAVATAGRTLKLLHCLKSTGIHSQQTNTE